MNRRKKRTNAFVGRLFTIIISINTLILFVLCAILFRRVNVLEEEVDRLIRWNAVPMIQAMTESGSSAKQNDPEKEKLSEMVNPTVQIGNTADTLPTEAETERETETSTAPARETETEETIDEASRKKIYLTFDDGPSKNTNAILDILKEYDIKATFFVIGKTDETAQAAYRRIVEEGHTLGMHSYSHAYGEVYASVEAFEADLIRLQNYLFEVTGVMPEYYRFPGGSSNTISEIDMQEFIACLHEHGVEYFDWNVSSGDGMSNVPDTETMLASVMRDVVKYEHSVVLLHDDANKSRTVESLPTLIETLTDFHCKLLPIDDTVEPVQHLRPEDRKVEDLNHAE